MPHGWLKKKAPMSLGGLTIQLLAVFTYPIPSGSGYALSLGNIVTRRAKHNLIPDPVLTLSHTDQICGPSYNPSCLKTNLSRIKEFDERAYVESFPGKDSGGRLSQVVPVPDTKWKNARPDYLEDILVWGAGSGFAATLGLFALALFLLFWWVLPSVFAEQYRLRDEKKPPRFTTNSMSLQMGSGTDLIHCCC